jgi:hypothetical protein
MVKISSKDFYRGSLQNGPLRGSGAGQKHPASLEHRSGSLPWQRGWVKFPIEPEDFFVDSSAA